MNVGELKRILDDLPEEYKVKIADWVEGYVPDKELKYGDYTIEPLDSSIVLGRDR